MSLRFPALLRELQPPTRDVTLMLQNFKKAPYTHLHDTSYWVFSLKMCFLLTLTLAKHGEEMHGLLYDV